MPEQFPSETVEAGTRNETVAAEAQPESGARGMLRDAIEKVMKEIEHHEAEAGAGDSSPAQRAQPT